MGSEGGRQRPAIAPGAPTEQRAPVFAPPPLTYPLAEAERELRRLREALKRIERRLDRVERILRRHVEAPDGGSAI